jgi:uncharacterized membrane protein YfcA
LSLEVFLILFGVGVAAGLLSGMFGVGGGIVVVPSLLAVYSLIGFNSPYVVHVAISTSLFTIIFTSTSSSYKHSKHGNVLWAAAFLIGLASAAAVFFFSKLALVLPGDVLKTVFAIVLVIVGVMMLTEKTHGNNKDEKICEPGKIKKIYCIMIGALAGTIAALTGLGGGIFKVPLLHYGAKVPIRKSFGTSAAALFITSLAGVISYIVNSPAGADTMKYSIGIVDALSAIPIVMASIPFAQVGVYINKKTRSQLLKKLFAGLILIVAVKMLFF